MSFTEFDQYADHIASDIPARFDPMGLGEARALARRYFPSENRWFVNQVAHALVASYQQAAA